MVGGETNSNFHNFTKLLITKSEIMKEGIWISKKLNRVPNYNVNFTNWIECQYYKGQIKIEFKILSEDKYPEGELMMKIFAPVIYSGGIDGFICVSQYLASELDSKARSINTNKTIMKLKLITNSLLEVESLYGENRVFTKLEK